MADYFTSNTMSCLSKWASHPSKYTCMRWMMWRVVTAWCLAATISHTTPQIWVVTTTSLLFFLLPGLHVGCGSTGLDHFRTQAVEATPGECSSHLGGQQLKKGEWKHPEPLIASAWVGTWSCLISFYLLGEKWSGDDGSERGDICWSWIQSTIVT